MLSFKWWYLKRSIVNKGKRLRLDFHLPQNMDYLIKIWYPRTEWIYNWWIEQKNRYQTKVDTGGVACDCGPVEARMRWKWSFWKLQLLPSPFPIQCFYFYFYAIFFVPHPYFHHQGSWKGHGKAGWKTSPTRNGDRRVQPPTGLSISNHVLHSSSSSLDESESERRNK